MIEGCLHECQHCQNVFVCVPGGCGIGYWSKLCSWCANRGWQMGECPKCKLLVPIHDSKWGCDECVRVMVVA